MNNIRIHFDNTKIIFTNYNILKKWIKSLRQSIPYNVYTSRLDELGSCITCINLKIEMLSNQIITEDDTISDDISKVSQEILDIAEEILALIRRDALLL